MAESRFQKALSDNTTVHLTAEQRQQLEAHWQLVKQWNERTNLTAILDDADAAARHYADSLAGLPVLPAGPTVDFGSGAGYPGIPLAIAEPGRQLLLIEPRKKRVSFLEVSVARLGLKNVRVREASSTNIPDQTYAAAVTRATFSDPQDLAACLRWLEPGAPLVAFRTDPSGVSGTELHRYSIQGQPRVLEIFRRS